MSETKFTKGPWWLKHSSGLDVAANRQRGPEIIAQSMVLSCDGSDVSAERACDEEHANAHLISAAPEMYEACAAAVANLTPLYPGDHHVMRLLRAALAKARGEQ